VTSSNQRLHVLPREHVTRHFGIVEIVERTDKFDALNRPGFAGDSAGWILTVASGTGVGPLW